jgi:Rrf2 family nitric oxide-sensitive transcriptional repressor
VVLRELEGEAELVDCEGSGCRLRADCSLRDALKAGMAAFYSAMDGYTLADIAGSSTGEHVVHMHRTFLQQGGAGHTPLNF